MKAVLKFTGKKPSRQFAAYALAVLFGLATFALVTRAYAASSVPMCYQGFTIYVPADDTQAYVDQGATFGVCNPSPP
jgi:hypothetical protein